jgi:DNA replication protein DnaC
VTDDQRTHQGGQRLSFELQGVTPNPELEDLPEDEKCPVCDSFGEYLDISGKMVVCNCPEGRAILERRHKNQFAGSGVPRGYQHRTFADFDVLGSGSGKVIALEVMRRVAQFPDQAFPLASIYENFSIPAEGAWATTPRLNVILYGPYGTGKTSLAAVVANYQLTQKGGRSVLFMKARDIVAAVQDTYSTKTPRMAVITPLREVPILIIDEMKPDVTDTDDRRQVWYDVLRGRIEDQKLTIMTTNFTKDQMHAAWGDQIAVEVNQSSHWILVGGQDMRVQDQADESYFF